MTLPFFSCRPDHSIFRPSIRWRGGRARWSLVLSAAALLVVMGCEVASAPKPAAESSRTKSGSASPTTPSADEAGNETAARSSQAALVEVKIDLPEGDDLVFEVPLPSEATVASVMQAAAERSSFSFESRGNGSSLFVTSIAGVANAGSGGDNWVYRVNGELGDCSAGTKSVEKGDKILWSFGRVKFDDSN